jgi:hypothetical protein
MGFNQSFGYRFGSERVGLNVDSLLGGFDLLDDGLDATALGRKEYFDLAGYRRRGVGGLLGRVREGRGRGIERRKAGFLWSLGRNSRFLGEDYLQRL